MTRKARTLELLRMAPRCGQELQDGGSGYRYSARIGELRSEGYAITNKTCVRHPHTARMVEFTLQGWDDGQGEFAL